MQIGPYQLVNPVIAAPMAGVTDKPYRQVCRDHGAAMVVSEMITSQSGLRDSAKTKFRSDLDGEPEPVVVQIVGTEPDELASAAQYNVANGAQIIDINMGCPAKKVCKKAAGSALLADEQRVSEILTRVVEAVDVPVTVKIRTGIAPERRNAVAIGKIAEQAGISAITIHGRTKDCKFDGHAEYDTIAEVKQHLSIPVVLNGDITSPEAALTALKHTEADAVMIGRAAQGQPWLYRQVADFLATGQHTAAPDLAIRVRTVLKHIGAVHEFYGPGMGVRLARKHIKWYLAHWPVSIDDQVRRAITTTDNAAQQRDLLAQFLTFSQLHHAA